MSDVDNVLYTHFTKLATDYDLFEDFPVLQQTTISLRRTSLFCNGLRPL